MVPFKIVSISAVLYPRWPPLQKIEISSNGQNCSYLSQKVPKFELYKHYDELFNIKNTDWLAGNQNNVSEWSDMSTRGLLFNANSAIFQL